MLALQPRERLTLGCARRLLSCFLPPVGRRRRRGALLAARPGSAARGAPVRPGERARRCPGRRRRALARTRRDARPRRAGWPWSSSLRWRRVDRWRAGEGRWQVWWCAEGVRCRKVATLHQAPSGSGAQGRERRAALSSVALSPREVSRCRASSKTRSPYEAVNAAIACVSARPAERPRQLAGRPAPALPGCQPIAGDHGGSAPKPPGAAVPRGSAWVGRWKDATAARSKAGARGGAPSRCRTRWRTTVPRLGHT